MWQAPSCIALKLLLESSLVKSDVNCVTFLSLSLIVLLFILAHFMPGSCNKWYIVTYSMTYNLYGVLIHPHCLKML